MKKNLILLFVLSLILSGCSLPFFNNDKGNKENSDSYLEILELADYMAINKEYEQALSLCERAFYDFDKDRVDAYILYLDYGERLNSEISLEDPIDYVNYIIEVQRNLNSKASYNQKFLEYLATYYLSKGEFTTAYMYLALINDSDNNKMIRYYQQIIDVMTSNTENTTIEVVLETIVSEIEGIEDTKERYDMYQSILSIVENIDPNADYVLNIETKLLNTAKLLYEKDETFENEYGNLTLKYAENYYGKEEYELALDYYILANESISLEKNTLFRMAKLYKDYGNQNNAKEFIKSLLDNYPGDTELTIIYAELLVTIELNKSKDIRDYTEVFSIYANLKLKTSIDENEQFKKFHEILIENNLIEG